jgi:tripartite ATP-independent transporter DctP family solute receptor
MKRTISLVLALVMTVTVLAGCGIQSSQAPAPAPSAAPAPAGPSGAGSTAPEYKKQTIKLSTAGTELGIDSLAAYHFADLVKEASGGQITINVFANSSLAGGTMAKLIEILVAGGAYELAVVSGSTLSNINEKFLIHQVPFIFTGYDHAAKVMDETGGAYYAKLMDEKGLTYMGGMYNGMRQLSNSNRPVVTPEDLKNLKIRIPSGEVYMKMMQEFGADPVAMTWTEVFTALQQKALDGQENGYQTMFSNNIHEVNKYVTEWNWSFDGYWFVNNKKEFAKFDEATQKLLMEKAEEAALWGRDKLVNDEIQIKKDYIEKYGVTVTELTPEQHQKFADYAKPVQKYFIDKYGAEGCSAWGF